MIFGVSCGDAYLGIVLLKDCLQALSDSKGSQKQYVDAVRQLEILETCLKVAQCKLSGLDADDSHNIVARAISECGKCIDSYQTEILDKYEKFFGEETRNGTRRKFLRELKKIQWLHEKDKTEALSKAIGAHVQIITLACSIGSLYVLTSASLPNGLLSDRRTDLEAKTATETRQDFQPRYPKFFNPRAIHPLQSLTQHI